MHLPPGPIRNGNAISVDLLSFVLPRYSTLVGGTALRPITRHFMVTDVEDGAYLRAFLVVLAALAVLERRRRSTWLLLTFVALVAVAALGPVLHVHGHPTVVPMPWGLTAHVPLLRDAVPARLTLFVWLGTAVIVALMLARARGWIAWASWGLVAMGAITILPATSSPPITRRCKCRHSSRAATTAGTSGRARSCSPSRTIAARRCCGRWRRACTSAWREATSASLRIWSRPGCSGRTARSRRTRPGSGA